MEPETKICKKCGEEKPLSEFPKGDPQYKYIETLWGIEKVLTRRCSTNICKTCKNIDSQIEYYKNKDKILKRQREYRSIPEVKKRRNKWFLEYSKTLKGKEIRKKYDRKYWSYPENKEKRKEYFKNMRNKACKELLKSYILARLRNAGLKYCEIKNNLELIEQRRTIIKAKRLIKQLKQKENATS